MTVATVAKLLRVLPSQPVASTVPVQSTAMRAGAVGLRQTDFYGVALAIYRHRPVTRRVDRRTVHALAVERHGEIALPVDGDQAAGAAQFQ